MSKATYTISMTSKGTFTLPAKIRKDLGLKQQGDKLLIDYSPISKEITIKKPVDFHAMQAEIAGLLPKDLPVFDLQKIRKQKHDARFN